MPLSEADTSRKFIIPKLQAAGWDNDPHTIAEQRSIEENDRAWRVTAEELLAANCNLDRKNPTAKDDKIHLPPEELVASILEKEHRIMEIVGRIKTLLEKKA